MRKPIGVEAPPYPMAEKTEEESHNLHLSWCYEIVKLKFEIATLESNMKTQKGLWWTCKISSACATIAIQ